MDGSRSTEAVVDTGPGTDAAAAQAHVAPAQKVFRRAQRVKTAGPKLGEDRPRETVGVLLLAGRGLEDEASTQETALASTLRS